MTIQYIFILILVCYGILNIRYATTDLQQIPKAIQFLFPNKFLDIFLFIPASKRVMATRYVTGIASLFVAGTMIYALFI